MSAIIPDQAEGLRRMFSRSLVRTVTFAAGGTSRRHSALVGDVAVALARRGLNVCVVEQGASVKGAAFRLGLAFRHDLAEFIRRDRRLEEVMLTGPEGVRFVHAETAGRLLGSLPLEEESRLTEAFDQLQPRVDVLVLDAPSTPAEGVAPWAIASSEIVVVASAAADGITEAYGLIKRLSRDAARRRFHIVVTRAGAEDHARAVYDSLAATARRFLSVGVAWLGWIPEDPEMVKAVRLHQAVSSAFPSSPAAIAVGAVADTLLSWPYAGEDCLDGFVHRLVQASRTSSSNNARVN